MAYIFSMLIMIAFYIGAICSMKYMKATKLWNVIFTCSIFAFYMFVMVSVYLSVGFNDWNFQNTLPTANVSPFMFTLVVVMNLFPQKIKKYIHLLVTLLSMGMFLAAIFGCVYNASIHYKFHIHFICDYMAHVMLSLWGVYLVKSKQVEINIPNSLISGAIIVGVALVMMMLNVVLGTSFFGLSLDGNHNIYNNVLVNNSYLSAVIYYVGLMIVLALGYVYVGVICRRNYG